MHSRNCEVFSFMQNLIRLCRFRRLGRFLMFCRFIARLLLYGVCFQLEAFCNAVYNALCDGFFVCLVFSAMSALLSMKHVSNKAELIPKHLHV